MVADGKKKILNCKVANFVCSYCLSKWNSNVLMLTPNIWTLPYFRKMYWLPAKSIVILSYSLVMRHIHVTSVCLNLIGKINFILWYLLRKRLYKIKWLMNKFTPLFLHLSTCPSVINKSTQALMFKFSSTVRLNTLLHANTIINVLLNTGVTYERYRIVKWLL